MDFFHPDFSRFATGLFHLRPLVPPEVPQWNLSAVIRFYEQVDHHTCSPRHFFLKPFASQPWPLGIGVLN